MVIARFMPSAAIEKRMGVCAGGLVGMVIAGKFLAQSLL